MERQCVWLCVKKVRASNSLMGDLKMTNYIFLAIISYLLGSLNFSIILSKLMGDDIRNHGSGNAGATNALRTMGGSKTSIVFAGDALKAVLAIVFAFYLVPGAFGKLFAGVFVILGHIFPIYFGFRGGKGVLTGAAVIFLFDVRIFLIVATIFFATAFITKYVSLSSILGAIAFPISAYYFYRDDTKIIITCLMMGAGVVLMHRKNIIRLIRGEESKVSFKKDKK